MDRGSEPGASNNNDPDIDRSRASRIQELNKIDQDVAKILRLAGETIQVLGNVSADGENDQKLSLDDRKKAFLGGVEEYYKLLSSVDVNLRRQILALEEANIIPVGNIPGVAGASKNATKTPGALGSLDVGWLNSRNDTVGKEMEAEVWAEARELVDSLSNETRESLEDDKMDSS